MFVRKKKNKSGVISVQIIDKGRYKNNYLKIDLDSYTQIKVSCNEVPRGCPYEKIIDNQETYFEDTGLTISNNEWYILKYDDYKLEIYLEATTQQHFDITTKGNDVGQTFWTAPYF